MESAKDPFTGLNIFKWMEEKKNHMPIKLNLANISLAFIIICSLNNRNINTVSLND